MLSSTTLFVAHGQELFLAGLVAIATDRGIRLAGVASTADAALAGIRDKRPTVALLDCDLPGIFAAVRTVSADARVLLFTTRGDANQMARAAAAGALNCLSAGDTGESIERAVLQAARGLRPSLPDPFAVVAASLSAADPATVDAHLTVRERQVLRHLAYGFDNDEIAAALAIGVETVKTHVHKLLRKMELRDRTQAAVWAVRHGVA